MRARRRRACSASSATLPAAAQRHHLVGVRAALRLDQRDGVASHRSGRAEDADPPPHAGSPPPNNLHSARNHRPPSRASSRSITPPCPGISRLAVLDPEAALHGALQEIAGLRGDRDPGAQDAGARQAPALRRGVGEPDDDGAAEPAGRARPGLAGADRGPELGAADRTSDEVGADVRRDHYERQPDHERESLGAAAQRHQEGHRRGEIDEPRRKQTLRRGRFGQEDGGAPGEDERQGGGGCHAPDREHRQRAAAAEQEHPRRERIAVPGRKPAQLPEHQRGRAGGHHRQPDAAEPDHGEGDGGDHEAGGQARPEVAELRPPRRRDGHPATAPNLRSRRPKPRTCAANISAVKSGQRVSIKANSE